MTMNKCAAVVCAASAVIMVAACGGSQRQVAGTVATQSVREFQNSLTTAPRQIDDVVSTLNTLTSGKDVDRQALLTQFNQQMRLLDTQASNVRRMRDQALTDSDRFFSTWLRETSGIRSASERDAAIADLTANRQRAQQARDYLDRGSENFRTLMNELGGIQNTLNKDLSPATVQSVGSNLAPVFDRSKDVNNFLARMNEQIESILMGR
jgi:hypothetical protein